MPYITIKTNTDEGFITLQERVVPGDMESEFFRAHLPERVRSAVEDAHVGLRPWPSSIARTTVDLPGRSSPPRELRCDARPPRRAQGA